MSPSISQQSTRCRMLTVDVYTNMDAMNQHSWDMNTMSWYKDVLAYHGARRCTASHSNNNACVYVLLERRVHVDATLHQHTTELYTALHGISTVWV